MSERIPQEMVDATFKEMMGEVVVDISEAETEHPMYRRLRVLGYTEDDIREMLGFNEGGTDEV